MMNAPYTIPEVEAKWREWIKDNPDADIHQQYYAAGVIDGLRYALTGEPFSPDWKATLAAILRGDRMANLEIEINLWQHGLGPKPKGVLIDTVRDTKRRRAWR